MISSIGTYLPPWGSGLHRQTGGDEDALTMAVAAGRQAIGTAGAEVAAVILISRELPLLEGDSSAALLAGLGLSSGLAVREQIGGAVTTLNALTDAAVGSLVIGVDADLQAGAAAAFVGGDGLSVELVDRVNRSLPVVARDFDGNTYAYDDPRLLRERGFVASLSVLQGGGLGLLVGLSPKELKSLRRSDQEHLPTTGASAPLFALASMTLTGSTCVVAVDQASAISARVSGSRPTVSRDEVEARGKPATTMTEGPPIPISLSAYDRAFGPKLRFQASRSVQDDELHVPVRAHDARRDAAGEIDLVDLPRTATVYTSSTIHVPVPGKTTPYQLVIVELDHASRIRVLAPTTASGQPLPIGARGELVLRVMANRSGVPDYGYAFRGKEN